MIIEERKDQVESNLSGRKTFGVQLNRVAFETLVRNIYPDIHRAVLMELFQNAYDSQKLAGRENVPIKIKLPTILDPVLHVEDCGIGMSDEFVMSRYTMIFDSTKRGSNKENGGYGVGRISALALAGSYNLESKHNGVKNVYAIFYNADGAPDIVRIATEKIDTGETGVKVYTNVKSEDVAKIQQCAQQVFYYVPVMPEFEGANFESKNHFQETWDYDDEFIKCKFSEDDFNHNSDVICHDGLYGYKVNRSADKFILAGKYVLKADIGSVTPTIGRDALVNDDKTNAIIQDRIEKVNKIIVTSALDKVKNAENIRTAVSLFHNFRYQLRHHNTSYGSFTYNDIDLKEFANNPAVYYLTNTNVCVLTSYNITSKNDKKKLNSSYVNVITANAASEYYFDDTNDVKVKNRVKNLLKDKPEGTNVVVIQVEAANPSSLPKVDINSIYSDIKKLSEVSATSCFLNERQVKATKPRFKQGDFRMATGARSLQYGDSTYNFGYDFNFDLENAKECYYVTSENGKITSLAPGKSYCLKDISSVMEVYGDGAVNVIIVNKNQKKKLDSYPHVRPLSELLEKYQKAINKIEDKYKFAAEYKGSYLMANIHKLLESPILAKHSLLTELGTANKQTPLIYALQNNTSPSPTYIKKMSKFKFFYNNSGYLTEERVGDMVETLERLV